MFFYAALEKDKHFLLDSPGIAWSPAGIASFFCQSGVIRLPGPVRFLFPARRPRGFLDRGFRFRFPDRSLWLRFLIRLCRTEIPARRPRGFLVQGCRRRFPLPGTARAVLFAGALTFSLGSDALAFSGGRRLGAEAVSGAVPRRIAAVGAAL